ncbi:Thioredoxin H2-2 [Morus notabilis]|uniref:Thioredoxin H2-2 n=1 Tax=Morus notabilis TaxID=981085 RepID=W9QE25_9ROSA|nr:Thioredoxin H2-2 [Morus notabilis]
MLLRRVLRRASISNALFAPRFSFSSSLLRKCPLSSSSEIPRNSFVEQWDDPNQTIPQPTATISVDRSGLCNPPEKTVIDFSATWCGPCKFMEPIYNDMAARFSDVDFVKIDVDELSDVAQEFGVQAMPTFVLTKKGKEVDRVVGAKKDELERKVQKHRS